MAVLEKVVSPYPRDSTGKTLTRPWSQLIYKDAELILLTTQVDVKHFLRLLYLHYEQ